MRRIAFALAVCACLCAVAVAPALAAGHTGASSGPRLSHELERFPTPPGCRAVSLADETGGPFCTQALLVTGTDNSRGDSFTVTDGQTTRTGREIGRAHV